MPSQEYLRARHDYNPDTGEYISKRFKKQLGSRGKRGQLRAKVQGKPYFVHRLIWVWMTGEDPGDNQIDHIDGNPSNNAWSNLRLCTCAQNSQNRRLPLSSTGFRGVYRCTNSGSFFSSIVCEGKGHYLGVFPTAEAASAAYELKATELFGEFNPQ